MLKIAAIFFAGLIGVIVLVIGISPLFVEGPLRDYLESEINENLEGYSVELEDVDVHPFGLSIDLNNVIVRQEMNPEPPIVTLDYLTVDVHWMPLVRMEIVSDLVIENASIVLQDAQIQHVLESEKEERDLDWQDAIATRYPVTVNVSITNSSISYPGPDEQPPLEVHNMQLKLNHIQNARSPDGEYPSTLHVEADMPGAASLMVSGKANALADPFPGISVDFEVKNVDLTRYIPYVPEKFLVNTELRSGALTGKGHVEYAPWKQLAHIARVELDRVDVAYSDRDSQKQQDAKPGASNTPDNAPEESMKEGEPIHVIVETLHLTNGAVSYIGLPEHPPLELRDIQFRAGNIQNIRSPDGEYPTTLHLEAIMYDAGVVIVSGKANVLADPFPGMSVDFEIKDANLKPLVLDVFLVNLEIRFGKINGQGHVEYAPWKQMAHIKRMKLENPYVDYIESERLKQAAVSSEEPDASKAGEEPIQLVLDKVLIQNGEVGFINPDIDPPYRIFFANLDLNIESVRENAQHIPEENQFVLSGKFMGDGEMSAEGRFEPKINNPAFEIKALIDDTNMTRLNDIFKAYGKFDVKQGTFSLMSELNVQEGNVEGYIKPFFQDTEIYDFAEDKNQQISQQIYEAIVGGLFSILENPQDQVATKAEVSGELDEKIQVSIWKAIGRLLKNGFITALTLTFEEAQ